jgi:single-stranded DNA-specific DHH superfamily exonuclease
MEHEIKEVVVRPYNKRESDFDDDSDSNGGEAVRDALRLHRLLLDQFGNELNLIINVIMTMDGRFDDIKDEMECRFQEEDYKFEVVFEELSKLNKRRRVIRE